MLDGVDLMCGMVDHYLKVFAGLKTEVVSPDKPLLLMAVLDLIAHGRLHRNFIDPSPELVLRFQDYQKLLPSKIVSVNLAEPFIGLETEDFWHLRPCHLDGVTREHGINTVEILRTCYFGAKLSDDLFPLLQMPASREKLRNVLLESYFSKERQQQLRELSSKLIPATEQM
jgi:putative restriction endonuclease